MNLKGLLRHFLNFLHLDLSKNLEYDRLTLTIMKKVIKVDSNCIDVGCHKGEILKVMIRLAPRGSHFAFEPLPDYFKQLQTDFSQGVSLYNLALSDHSGMTAFQFVKNAPAFSGIRKRSYLVNEADIEEIQVEMKTLDELIPPGQKIHFIKIDVEGGELNVLKGASRVLRECQPIVIFEFGKGAADHYGTSPEDIYNEFHLHGMSINTLKGYLKKRTPLSLIELKSLFDGGREYYFISSPPSHS